MLLLCQKKVRLNKTMLRESIQIDIKPPLELVNCKLGHSGFSAANNHDYIPTHYHHANYELTAVVKGNGISYANGVPTKVKKGDIYVSFPNEYHKVDSDPDDLLNYVFVTFIPNGGKFDEPLRDVWQNNIPPEKRVFRSDGVITAIESIITELQNRNFSYSEEMLSSLMDQIIINTLRSFEYNRPQVLSKHPTTDELCRHISHYIDTHIYTIKSLKEISRAFSYNYSYLSAVYRRTTGMSIAGYYLAKRMELAQVMLVQQRYSVTEIAEKLNYADIYSFSKAFSAYFGQPPKKYAESVFK